MNEQIEKLAELSGFKQDMLNIGIWYSPEFQKFAERFAELIVAECLEACSRANEIRHLVPPTQEQVVLSCMREIENTFRS